MNSLSKWIYIKENDNAARYVLGVEGKSPLIFFLELTQVQQSRINLIILLKMLLN